MRDKHLWQPNCISISESAPAMLSKGKRNDKAASWECSDDCDLDLQKQFTKYLDRLVGFANLRARCTKVKKMALSNTCSSNSYLTAKRSGRKPKTNGVLANSRVRCGAF